MLRSRQASPPQLEYNTIKKQYHEQWRQALGTSLLPLRPALRSQLSPGQLTRAPCVFGAAIGQQVKLADGNAHAISWVDSLPTSPLVCCKESIPDDVGLRGTTQVAVGGCHTDAQPAKARHLILAVRCFLAGRAWSSCMRHAQLSQCKDLDSEAQPNAIRGMDHAKMCGKGDA